MFVGAQDCGPVQQRTERQPARATTGDPSDCVCDGMIAGQLVGGMGTGGEMHRLAAVRTPLAGLSTDNGGDGLTEQRGKL